LLLGFFTCFLWPIGAGPLVFLQRASVFNKFSSTLQKGGAQVLDN